jgi:hypothetical protein
MLRGDQRLSLKGSANSHFQPFIGYMRLYDFSAISERDLELQSGPPSLGSPGILHARSIGRRDTRAGP